MLPSHHPVESLMESFRAVESGLRRAAKDIESHWLLQHENAGRRVKDLRFFGDRGDARCLIDESEGLGKKRRHQGSDGVIANEKDRNVVYTPLPVGDMVESGGRRKVGENPCSGCLHFATSCSIVFGSLVQAFPSSVKFVKKCFQKQCVRKNGGLRSSDSKIAGKGLNLEASVEVWGCDDDNKDKALPLDVLLCCAVDNLVQGFHMFDQNSKNLEMKIDDTTVSDSSSQFDHMKVIGGIIKGKKADIDCFLSNMGFARVGGAPSNLVDMVSPVKDDAKGAHPDDSCHGAAHEANSAQKLASGLLNIPLSNMERLKSTLSSLSLSELIEYVPHIGRSSKDHPDKKKLFSVQDFFVYTEAEGKRFFEELDRDGDGQVTLEDLEVAMRKRKLPKRYARDFFRRTRCHLFSKSFGWKQFLSLIKQKDPTILRAYTTLCLSKSGTLQKNHILTSLESAGLPGNEDNAAAMLRCLVSDVGGSISYSHFRNFMILLPSDRLEEDPRSIWFEAATVVAVPPPVEIPTSSVLKAALAGGMACALSTSLMHPIDTMKTRVQASTLSFPELIAKLPQIGFEGLYRGSIPAIIGQFSSHGLRTGIFEASKLLLINVAPTLPDIQVQSISSFCSTILGTAVRIPCEVLKQRLQAGIFDNVGEALVGTIRQDGFKGFFRGTGATLCREVPFYVAGLGLYAEAKKATQHLLNRELEPWEVIIVGALSGGLAAVVTTPFDVMKTRMMTARQGRPVSMSMVALSILHREGPLGLFKGAVPRFFWIAPLGAMNFAGYELAKKAMDRPEPLTGDQE